MRRSPFAALIPVLVASAAIGALMVADFGRHPAALGQATQTRPSVLVIETDDQALESMRVMRNVNSLIGDQGATFTNSFVNYSLCCPSRVTFLTGQYAHNHRVLDNQAPSGGFARFHALHRGNNLAVWLQGAGYHTALIGKYMNGYNNNPLVPQGWSEWHAAAPTANMQAYFNYTLNNNGTLVDYGQKPSEYKTDVLTSKAVNFVNRIAPRTQPFFLWLTYTAPHTGDPVTTPNPPFDCYRTSEWPITSYRTPKPAPRHADAFDFAPLPRPPNFNEADVSDKPAHIRSLPRLDAQTTRYLQRQYRCQLKSLLSVDEGVKRVVDALSAKGELDDTLIVYTSDNGYFLGHHRIPREKMHIYEESIRVPLLMRGPGIPQGANVSDLATNADLAPTIVEVAKANPGLVMDGRSLIPVAQQPGIDPQRELLIEEPARENRPSFEAIRTDTYMYAEHGSGEEEFYDLTLDPFELQSLHDDPAYASVKALLAHRLDQLRDCAGPSCRVHP